MWLSSADPEIDFGVVLRAKHGDKLEPVTDSGNDLQGFVNYINQELNTNSDYYWYRR